MPVIDFQKLDPPLDPMDQRELELFITMLRRIARVHLIRSVEFQLCSGLRIHEKLVSGDDMLAAIEAQESLNQIFHWGERLGYQKFLCPTYMLSKKYARYEARFFFRQIWFVANCRLG